MSSFRWELSFLKHLGKIDKRFEIENWFMETSNYRKHTSKNPLQKFLIGNFYKELISSIKKLTIESALDVGCGEGFTLNKLSENKIGKRLEGIDFQKTAIDAGKRVHPNLNLKVGNIYHLPYKDNSFDLIICTEVLEHLEDPKKALSEIQRVSSRYVILSVPNEPFFMIANFLRGKNLRRWGNDIEHIHHWSSKGFQKFVENQSVKVIQKKLPFPWTLLLMEK